jgi:hypothetical protein
VVGMKNCPPACFFLDNDGLCGIQVEHGYDAKPETCRFSRLTGCLAWVIISSFVPIPECVRWKCCRLTPEARYQIIARFSVQ